MTPNQRIALVVLLAVVAALTGAALGAWLDLVRMMGA